MPPHSSNLGEFQILKQLSPSHTYHAIGRGGQQVILKRLEDDCLYDAKLHVSIKERLERIQQVPHIGIANLLGVERIDNAAYQVWEYIDGTPLEQYLTTPDSRGRLPDLVDIGRELVLSVEGLAKLGLVHGAIHGGNIFVTDRGLRLTHLSPYLYSDPQVDADAVINLLLDSLNRRYTPGDLPVHNLLLRAAENHYDLATFGPLLACPPDSPLSPQQMIPRQRRQRGFRTRAVLLALFILLIGVGITTAELISAGVIPQPHPAQIRQQFTDWKTRLGF